MSDNNNASKGTATGKPQSKPDTKNCTNSAEYAPENRCPVYISTTRSLKFKMDELGYNVEFVGPPTAIENLQFRGMASSDAIIDEDLCYNELRESSKQRIHDYLKEMSADGGLALDVNVSDNYYYCNMTIAPFKLISKNKKNDSSSS